mmetsp:Transcript_25240/g.73029  ORF Transcript_25240/g.73029 Transcript_25240/m.73029 type:complete len:558 (-) Transcript_25240:983-2656(-)
MMRQICCVPPLVVVKVACLFAALLVPTVVSTDMYSHRRDPGTSTDRQHLRSRRHLSDPASQPAAGAADITTPSAHIQQLERRDMSTECIECNQGSTRAAGPSQGNGQAATNNYERSDEKQDPKQDEDEHADSSLWSYYEPTLQPTIEVDNPASSSVLTRTKEDDNKVTESVEEEVECSWCHDDELDRRPDGPESGDDGFPDESFPDDPYDYPQADPDSYRDNNKGYGGGGASSYDHRLIDDMVAPFFLLAAVLLILALVYTLLFLCVVRLGTIRIDEDRYPRGRVYFCGSFCFVPLCWFYRLYAADPSGGVGIASTSDARVMGLKREERKEAVMELLKQYSATVGEDGGDEEVGGADADANTQLGDIPPAETSNSEPEVSETGPPSSREGEDDEALTDADENQCSICLDGYEIGDIYVTSPTTCTHRFHHDCLLDWLTRRCNTACPCCRRDLISNDDVWDIHQQKGRERRRKRRKEQGGIRNRLGALRRRGRREDGVIVEGDGENAGVTAGSLVRPAAQAQEVPSSTLTSPTSTVGASDIESGQLEASEIFESEERV